MSTATLAPEPVIELNEVTKVYGQPAVYACGGVSLSINRGEFVAIVGPSGSGKSTLLNMIGSLDRPTSGSVTIAGNNVEDMSDDALSGLRAHAIGFVFQQFHLAEGVSAQDNVADGLLYRGTSLAKRRKLAAEALDQVGLGKRISHMPNQLSGGERQRVAIARAIVSQPTILLADEPTGNLDTTSGARVVELLRRFNEQGTTIVVITHDMALARNLPRQICIRDGKIIDDSNEKAHTAHTAV